MFAAAIWFAPDRVFSALVTEDGPLEWLQVAALVVVLVVLVRGARRVTTRPARAAWVLGALAVFGGIGEEIAWGTRLFDVSVPAIQEANTQNEVTIHNLGGIRGLSKSFAVLAGIGVVGAVGVVRRRPGLAVWFAGPALYCAVRVLHDGPITPRFAKLSEVFELLLYVAMARVAVGGGFPDPAPAPAAAVGQAATVPLPTAR